MVSQVVGGSGFDITKKYLTSYKRREESARIVYGIVPRLLEHVSQLQLHSQEVGNSDHPALAGVLHNLRLLQRRNAIHGGEQARGL